jgi:hypothetical protein
VIDAIARRADSCKQEWCRPAAAAAERIEKRFGICVLCGSS